jgi:hypothetical protein
MLIVLATEGIANLAPNTIIKSAMALFTIGAINEGHLSVGQSAFDTLSFPHLSNSFPPLGVKQT